MIAREIEKTLRSRANPEKAALLQRFFKTGPGQYGEGDVFLGVMVPNIRRIAKRCQTAPIPEIVKLLHTPFHEQRLLALLILVLKFSKGDDALRKRIFSLYLKSTRYINNWDLVDLTAPHIVGVYLLEESRKQLYIFSRSRDLWKRRIAILSTFAFIRKNEFKDSLAIANVLLDDKHDLIHKAVGWMLREVGKRDVRVLEDFLKKRYHRMPRTMLRYAIERFPEQKRKRYLAGKV